MQREDSIPRISLVIPTPSDMEEVGAVLSYNCTAGDVILLGGDLGAGKTCLARGFVRGTTGDWDQPVTSPTYLLSNTYPTANDDGLLIHHMDLYRLSGDERDFVPLNLEHVFQECVSLIEWPSRLGSLLPPVHLDATLTISEERQHNTNDDEEDSDGDEEAAARILTLEPRGAKWEERLSFLLDEGYFDDLLVSSQDGE